MTIFWTNILINDWTILRHFHSLRFFTNGLAFLNFSILFYLLLYYWLHVTKVKATTNKETVYFKSDWLKMKKRKKCHLIKCINKWSISFQEKKLRRKKNTKKNVFVIKKTFDFHLKHETIIKTLLFFYSEYVQFTTYLKTES